MARETSDPRKQDESKSKRAERRAAERRASQGRQEEREHRGADSEQWNRRLIIGAVVAIIIIAFGFIAFGWYQTQIKPLGKTILRVEDTKISLAHLERRMERELELNAFIRQSQNSLLSLPDTVLAQLELEATLLAGISDLGIVVTEEDVAAEIRERGNLADEVEATIFADEFRSQVEASGLKRQEYEQQLRADIAAEKALAYFLYLGPKEEPQVRARLIVVNTEEVAQAALERLEAGEDFTALAEEISLDANAIDLDWFPRGGSLSVREDVSDFLFESEAGQRSEVISQFGFYYIVEVLERDEARLLDEAQRGQVADRQLGDWVLELSDTLDIERNFSQEDALRALEDIL